MHAWVDSETLGLVTRDASADAARAFEARLPELCALAFRVAYGVLRQRQDAEDVAQEALLKAHGHLGRLRDPDRVGAWLVRTAWRLALDHQRTVRRRRRREAVAPALAAPPPDAERLAADNEFRDRLWEAVDSLSGKLRVVTVLAALEGHDARETAALLGLPEGTVKSRLHAARRRLMEMLGGV